MGTLLKIDKDLRISYQNDVVIVEFLNLGRRVILRNIDSKLSISVKTDNDPIMDAHKNRVSDTEYLFGAFVAAATVPVESK